MKTGIYGGTFNPIHTAHVEILKDFIKALSLDRVLLIPTGTPPHKTAPELAPNEARLDMCRLAAREITACPVEVLDLEMRRAGKSFTADTLTALRADFPEDAFFLLMGEDMFMTVEKWRSPEIIFALSTVCCAPRGTDSVPRLEAHGAAVRAQYPQFRYVIQNTPYLEISSTEIRARVRCGKSLHGLVPEGVAAYILERGLYTA